MAHRELAIVGAGPKAAAIAAKASALRDLAGIDMRTTIFEESVPGAAWDGSHGLTDGEQRMCTVAERDIGFPYDVREFGQSISMAMQQRYSWHSYAVDTEQYAEWIDRGRRRLPHATFAAYVRWCIDKSSASVVTGKVTGLSFQNAKWHVEVKTSDGAKMHPERFDGVVVTGTGPAKRRFYLDPNPLILDGDTFWKESADLKERIDERYALNHDSENADPITILGSGGTAAAIAAKLHRMRLGRQITIIGSQPALFARIDSTFENKLFRDTEAWKMLGPKDRKAFTDRLTSGAVWSNVLDELADADLTYLPGQVRKVVFDEAGTSPADLMVGYEISAAEGGLEWCASAAVIDATGFDTAWFADLLPAHLKSKIRDDLDGMKAGLTKDLCLPIGVPNLHAPTLSQIVGPGHASLMALGSMSGAILHPYFRALT